MSRKWPKIQKLSEYLELVQEVSGQWQTQGTTIQPWFRGQEQATWSLVPGLYRGSIKSTLERELVRDFRLRSLPLLPSPPTHPLEWLFLMQHYGMPTRLLDWSENPLCALYFSVRNFHSKSDGAVWILHPWYLNRKTIGMTSAPTSDQKSLTPYYQREHDDRIERRVRAKLPVAVRPSHTTPRIQAQQGVFTLHGSSKLGLDQQLGQDLKFYLHKLIISGQRKKALLLELYRAGVREGSLFPDLLGLCSEIRFRYSRSFMARSRSTQNGRTSNSDTSPAMPAYHISQGFPRPDTTKSGLALKPNAPSESTGSNPQSDIPRRSSE